MSIERNLRLALHQLVEAIEYTPMGVRGIKAMANARKALEAAQQPATAIACGIPGMTKTTCPYCEQGFAFEHEQPATPEPTVPQEHEAYSRYLDAATPEPVLTVEREPDYWSGGHFCEGTKPHINPMKVWSLPIGTELYTHPAPSEPKLIEIAISSGCFGVLPVKATIPMCKAGWGASGGELTFQQIGHIYEEMYRARPLPDDAMIAAKEAT